MNIAAVRNLGNRSNSVALPVCLAAMDGCWVYLVAWLLATYVFGRITPLPVPGPPLLGLLQLAAIWTSSRLLDNHRLNENTARMLSGVAGVAASLFVAFLASPTNGDNFSPAWLGRSSLGLIVCLGLWFLGSYRGGEQIGFNEAYAGFRIGLAAIALCALLTALFGGSGGSKAWAGLGGVAVWFFAWALAALALGNRKLVRDEAGDTGRGPWSIVLLASIGGIVLLGSAGGAFGGGNSIIDLGERVVGAVLLAFGFLIYLLFFVVLTIGSLFASDKKSGPPRMRPPEDAFRIIGRFDPGNQDAAANIAQALGLPPGWYEPLMWLTTGLILLVAVWAVSRGMRRSRKDAVTTSDEERESLGSWALLVGQFQAWLRHLFRRNSAVPGPAASHDQDDLARLAGKPEWSGTLSVRQIYARLQKMAAAAGYPRSAQQTPLEYLAVLQRAMPNMGTDFTAITSAYLEARYGPAPASGPAVHAATEAWKRAEATLQAAISIDRK